MLRKQTTKRLRTAFLAAAGILGTNYLESSGQAQQPVRTPVMQIAGAPCQPYYGYSSPCPPPGTGSSGSLSDSSATVPEANLNNMDNAPQSAGPSGGDLASNVGGNLPNVLGDFPLGTGAVVTLGTTSFAIAHPNLNTSRINIAENNSPFPRNRVFYSYRHFGNVTRPDVAGYQSHMDIDQHVFGTEISGLDGLMSMEVRLPFQGQLANDLNFSYVTTDAGFDPASAAAANGLPLSGYQFTLGNVGLTWKMLLYQRETIALSGGIGMLLPTAQSVQFNGTVNMAMPLAGANTHLLIPLNPPLGGATFGAAQALVDGTITNDTVEITPYIGWAFTPVESNFFHQGFLQVGVPLNESRASINFDPLAAGGHIVLQGYDHQGNGYGPIDLDPVHARLRMLNQVLLRLDGQFGYWLKQTDTWSVAGIFEAHYIGTLNQAPMDRQELGELVPGDPNSNFVISTGNPLNSVHLVNLVAGLAGNYGQTQWQLGWTQPLNGGDRKPFDYEVHAAVNRRF